MKAKPTTSCIPPGLPGIPTARPRAAKLLGHVVAAFLAVALTACAAGPERAAWEVADARARWLDRFHLDERNCARHGGLIVQERHMPDALRVGPRQPEVGTRYWCVAQ